mmetsp:Transcript_10966/g.20150  ORF Transcript_10966/g.20150 Transcript_10966/m.20150 type:complete len:384 (-) Transcript_10966:115-1266(-)|eukprot:CAMPEP_0197525866 /NCGR_PEP_ID=MMETSP1318-20131121/15050_1 /TAXON_ID=552666 /ORGANISM="Partenskyella glossopodia, Strain RCC365" /LENGTH=383 /DNA_ID=CAMNT_0043079687 /DNA_START=86 /DNA_END=1240 /DNA_ORIENTATION=-
MSSATAKLAKIKKLQKVEGNATCTDCGSEDVSWAVLNHGFFVCVHCAGIHRGLGVQYSQVRSTELDVECWDEHKLAEFKAKGNNRARKIFEHAVPSYFLTPNDCEHPLVRKHWIESKYMSKAFCDGATSQPTLVRMPERALLGWLHKRNDAGKWQLRYVVLYRDKLSYFKDNNASLPNGQVDLGNADITIPERVMSPNGTKPPPFARFRFSIRTKAKTLNFAPDTESEVFKWCHALRRASIYYGQDAKAAALLSKLDINDSKVQYQDLASKVVHQGKLGKQGGAFASWKLRWFVLADDVLYYFKTAGEPKPADFSIGSIPISMCDVHEGEDAKNNKFCLITNSRTFFFQASSSAERLEWIEVLSKAVEGLIHKNGKDFSFQRK